MSALQVDFVDDRYDFETVIDGQVGVGQSLRFHTLRGVDHQERALAGSQRARDFVRKIHMAGGVDQVELILLAVMRGVLHTHGVGFDSDATFPLEIHRIQDLGLHLALGKRPGKLQQAVGERGFAMIDVGDNGKIADVCAVHRDGLSLLF